MYIRGILILFLALPASAYQGGSLKDHGHTSNPGDGGQLTALSISGLSTFTAVNVTTFTASTATISYLFISSNVIFPSGAVSFSSVTVSTFTAQYFNASGPAYFGSSVAFPNNSIYTTTANYSNCVGGSWCTIASTSTFLTSIIQFTNIDYRRPMRLWYTFRDAAASKIAVQLGGATGIYHGWNSEVSDVSGTNLTFSSAVYVNQSSCTINQVANRTASNHSGYIDIVPAGNSTTLTSLGFNPIARGFEESNTGSYNYSSSDWYCSSALGSNGTTLTIRGDIGPSSWTGVAWLTALMPPVAP